VLVGEDRPTCCALRSKSIMESGGTHETHVSSIGTVYRIVVRDELSGRFAAAFEGMEIETRCGRTILTGEVIDQAHLHGILDRIYGLGLKLVSVESMPEDPYSSR
jgi:hypothetical protein